MSWIKLFNFRGTSTYNGYDTAEGADETYVIPGSGYPQTRKGVTFGWVNSVVINGSDRNSSIDRRLAGLNYGGNPTAGEFIVDLPATGQYIIRLAIGDAYGPTADNLIEVLDDAASLFTHDHTSGFTSGSDLWRDATDVLRSATTWPTDNASRTETFNTTIFRLKLGNSSRFGRAVHVSLEQVEVATRRLILSSPA